MVVRHLGRTALAQRQPLPPQLLPPAFLLPLRARRASTDAPSRAAAPFDPDRLPPAHRPGFVFKHIPTKKTPASFNPEPPQPAKPPRFHKFVAQRRAAAVAGQPERPPPPSASILLPDPLRPQLPPAPAAAPTGPVPAAVAAQLPALAASGPHWATVHLHARPYLVTAGDRVRLPGLLKGVAPGDGLRLTCVSALGGRDLTLRGAPWVDARLVACRAVVAGVESEPLRVKEKTKRRNRRVKYVKSKHRYTELLISEVSVRASAEGLEVEGAAAPAADVAPGMVVAAGAPVGAIEAVRESMA